MNFDRFILFTILSFLPILWLPQAYLSLPCYLALGLLLYGVMKRKRSFMLLSLIIGVSYFQVVHISQTAAQFQQPKQQYQFQIRQILKQLDYQTAIATLADGKRIYLTWQTDTPLQLDQVYQAELTLRPVSGRLNQGNFDRQRWYFANHIDGIATVRKAVWLEKQPVSFRHQWLEQAKAQTDNLRTQGLLLALAFGERAWLNNEDWLLFQQTSTAHLIAISGLHIALTYWLGVWFGRAMQFGLLSLKPRSKGLQAVGFSLIFPKGLGVVVAIFYCYLAGFSIPTLRTLLAILILLACQLARRHYTPLQYWGRVVAVLLICDPLTILSDSFWLSAGAVLSLILWYRLFPWVNFPKPRFCKKTPLFDRLCAAIHLQLGIWLAFSPLQFFFFDGFANAGFLANLFSVPLYSFVLVPLILFSLISNNLFETWQWADCVAQASYPVLQALSGWSALSLWQQSIMLSLNLLFIGLIKNLIQRQSWRFNLGVGFVSLLILFSRYVQEKYQPEYQWITFDVGQGLAQALIYVEPTSGQKRAVFYDTGASWGEGSNSMAKLELLPYFKRQGIEIEAIFLSHDDLDHAGGVAELLNAYPNARLISSSQQPYEQHLPEACIAGKKWQFGRFELAAIYPEAIVERAKNADSCIILVKFDRLQWLLTGDTTIEQERIFSANLPPLDFLQVAHHGSKTSTSETLLAKTQPRLAIVSTGRWNPWKMPNKQVIERLERYNIAWLNTAEVGMIAVNLSEKGWEVQTARDLFSPWYQQIYGIEAKK